MPSLVGVALVVWLGIGSLGGMAQGKLSQVQTNDAAAFLPSSAESTRAAEESKAFVDTQTLPALVVLQPQDGGDVTPDQLAAVQEWAAGRAGPGAAGRERRHLVRLPRRHPAVVPSEDGQALLVAFSLDADKADELLADDEGVTDSFVLALRASLEEDPRRDGDLRGRARVCRPG